jgi:hypothetical protein
MSAPLGDAQYGRRSAVAKALGVSKQRLNGWITGKRKLDVENFFKVRRFLDERETGSIDNLLSNAV